MFLFDFLNLAASTKNNHLTAKLLFDKMHLWLRFILDNVKDKFNILQNCPRFDNSDSTKERQTMNRFFTISKLGKIIKPITNLWYI